MQKIYFDIKNTSANTIYMSIPKDDMDTIISICIGITSYMAELSLCPKADTKDLLKYYKSPNKTLPYHKQWKRHNSPQTFISGLVNNIMFGSQFDISETQGQHLQNIINMMSEIITVLEEVDIKLQKHNLIQSIMFVENLWEKP
jgi:hypothetical protein